MAILWMESFDIYGQDNTSLNQRGYAANVNTNVLQNSNARTGAGFLEIPVAFGEATLRRALDNPVSFCVQGVAIELTQLPPFSFNNQIGIRFGPFNDPNLVSVCVNSNLGLSVYIGNVLRGVSRNNLVVVDSYFFLEVKVISGTNGSVIVRVNNEQVIVVNNVNIPDISNCCLGKGVGDFAFGVTGRFDDWYILDDSGNTNNDFIGDRRVVTLMPDEDITPQDWTYSSGSQGWSLIDELNPNDAGFIKANNAGDIAQFNKADVPLDVNDVAAIQIIARAFKDNAGPNSFRIGINSNSIVDNSEEFFPNTTVAYFSKIFEQNPDGNLPWTRSAIDNAFIRFTREI